MKALRFDEERALYRCERCGEVFTELALLAARRTNHAWEDLTGVWHTQPLGEVFGYMPCGPVRLVDDFEGYIEAWEKAHGEKDTD